MPMKNQPYQFFRERLLYWAADISWVRAVSAHRPVLCLGWLHYRHPMYLKEPLEATWKDFYGLLGSITFTHTFEANSLWIKFIKNKKRIGAPPHLSCRMFWQCSVSPSGLSQQGKVRQGWPARAPGAAGMGSQCCWGHSPVLSTAPSPAISSALC